MRHPVTGKYVPDYTPEDFDLFVDMIKQGSTQEAFLDAVRQMYPKNSMWAILKWYTKARRIVEGK